MLRGIYVSYWFHIRSWFWRGTGMPIPKKGEVIERRGKKYEVRSVQPIVGKAIPTYIIRLMNTMWLSSDHLWIGALRVPQQWLIVPVSGKKQQSAEFESSAFSGHPWLVPKYDRVFAYREP
jgi:hypothetical protein